MSVLTMPRFTSVRPSASRIDSGHLAATLRLALRTWHSRRELPDLTARELADIGVSPAMAVTEAARLPWDIAPPSRRPASGLAATLERALERSRERYLTAGREAAKVPLRSIELYR